VCLTLAHLFHWLGAPAGADPSVLPLWVAFAITACLFLIAGGIAVMLGRKKIEAMTPPLHQTVQALQENIEWKTRTSPS
jgi:membrane protein implicated in regulation of membrane protease activity